MEIERERERERERRMKEKKRESSAMDDTIAWITEGRVSWIRCSSCVALMFASRYLRLFARLRPLLCRRERVCLCTRV